MDFRSFYLLWWLCIGDSWWVDCILNFYVCRNHGSRSSAFLWDVAVLLFLLCFLFLLVYHFVHLFVVFGKVGTGGCFAIGIEVVAGRELGCWVDKGLVDGAGKRWGGVAGKEQAWVLMLGKFGADIQDVVEWAEERCSVDSASWLLER